MNLQVIKKRILKIIKYTILGITTLLILTFALLQVPSVQTRLAAQATKSISKKLGYNITIEKVNIRWFDVAEFTNVKILDEDNTSFLHSESVYVDYQIKSLISDSLVTLDALTLNNPTIELKWFNESKKLNINKFLKKFRTYLKGNKKSKRKLVPIQINELAVINGQFDYRDERKKMMSDSARFDHNYFHIDSINGVAENLYIYLDTIQLKAHHVSAIDKKTGFRVHDLNTDFLFCKKSMHFVNINTNAGQSYITNCLRFDYDHIDQMVHFNDSIDIDANIDKARIHTKDLAIFAPNLRSFNDLWTISGDFTGKVNDFKINRFEGYFGRNSHISGDFDLEGLPDLQNTRMNILVKDAYVNTYDVKQYSVKDKYYSAFKKFGNSHMKGDFQGFPNNFVAHGQFQTQLGDFESDLKFELIEQEEYSKYSGHLKTYDFDIGKFLDRKYLGNINMDGKIAGSGFKIEDANLDIKAKIADIEIHKYKYQNIQTSAYLKKEFFNGDLSIEDTNLTMKVTGEINLAEENEVFNIKADVKKAQLREINLTSDSTFVKGLLVLDFNGLNLDSIEGKALFNDVYVYAQNNELKLRHFNFDSERKGDYRTFNIHSSLASFEAEGNFQFNQVWKDLDILAHEYYLNILNNKAKTDAYYASKDTLDAKKYKIHFASELSNVEPLLKLFYPEASIAKNTTLSGDFSNGKTTILNAYLKSEKLKIQQFAFSKNEGEFHFSKLYNKPNVLANFYLSSKRQSIYNIKRSENFEILGVWDKDLITFSTKIKQYQNSNAANLHGKFSFKDESIVMQLDDNSEMLLINKIWKVNRGNQIIVKIDEIDFNNFSISNKKERIKIEGIVNYEPNSPTNIEVSNFQLNNLSSFVPVKLNGSLNGNLQFIDWSENLTFEGFVNVKKLEVFDDYLGDFRGKINWSKKEAKLFADITAMRDDKDIGNIEGYYLTKDSISPLFFNVAFNNTDLSMLEPFMYGNVTDLEGEVTGSVDVRGSLKDPDFQGKVKIWDGALTIDYLKTRYTFQDRLYFDDDLILFKDITLKDTAYHTTGNITGFISHKMFKKFYANVDVFLDKSLILDTKSVDNSLYYGRAFATGHVNLKGPFSQIYITSPELRGTQWRNNYTLLYIPLEEEENIAQKDYIKFIPRSEREKVKEKEGNTNINLSGIRTDINFNITNDVKFEVIFDQKAGDIIKGTGQGQVHMEIDTRGDFNMYGSYEIREGTYNFTFMNVVNKKFLIQPNSTIYWSGDPYEGKLDILAKYKLKTDIKPLVNQSEFTVDTPIDPGITRNYPVEVALNLKGPLLSPLINFKIDIFNYPSTVENIVGPFQTRMRDDEQELNKQVFTLMFMKQFAPMSSNNLDIASGSISSVSELFSNQFSNWLSQWDPNLQVNFDWSGFDPLKDNIFNVEFEYNINNRARITQNNNFTNLDNENIANVFGEWTFEYTLDKEGKIRLKAYNKSGQTLNTDLTRSTTVYGVGFTHTASFDKFTDLIKRKKKEKELHSSQ